LRCTCGGQMKRRCFKLAIHALAVHLGTTPKLRA
jgi:hypothetical protein